MLRKLNDLYGFSVAASDGPIGEVRDCYFDDQAWTIPSFVVETGPWLGGRLAEPGAGTPPVRPLRPPRPPDRG